MALGVYLMKVRFTVYLLSISIYLKIMSKLYSKVEVPPLQVQVWGVHAGLTQLYHYFIM